MNKYILLFIVLSAGSAYCQKPKPIICSEMPSKHVAVDADTIISMAEVDEKPYFENGFEDFNKSFCAAFKMPSEKTDLMGRIFVEVVIEKNGTLSNIKIIRDLGLNTANEAIRVIKKMPKWSPAKYQGKVVRCRYVLPIRIPYKPLNLTADQLKRISEIQDKR